MYRSQLAATVRFGKWKPAFKPLHRCPLWQPYLCLKTNYVLVYGTYLHKSVWNHIPPVITLNTSMYVAE